MITSTESIARLRHHPPPSRRLLRVAFRVSAGLSTKDFPGPALPTLTHTACESFESSVELRATLNEQLTPQL
ncbi:hypothetical protein, partial [Vulcanococcus sp.]|uniref:hypothetical protein n=1 Tax=Vulcanococcus sp. TaxID=2856995 RepID=UPI0037DA6E7D